MIVYSLSVTYVYHYNASHIWTKIPGADADNTVGQNPQVKPRQGLRESPVTNKVKRKRRDTSCFGQLR